MRNVSVEEDFLDEEKPDNNPEMHCLNAVNLAQVLYKFNESVINTVLHQDSEGKQKAKDSSSQAAAAATGKVDPSANSAA